MNWYIEASLYIQATSDDHQVWVAVTNRLIQKTNNIKTSENCDWCFSSSSPLASTMSLIAYRSGSGEEVESFSISQDNWDAMRNESLGTYLMPYTDWPAVLKRSIRGTQFFAHAPGYAGLKPKPESESHQKAKIALAKALRGAGFIAGVERHGETPEGEAWQADVLCEARGRMIAFEVQLAQQTLEEYEHRSARYLRAGIKCVWLVRAKRHYGALSKAIHYRLERDGKKYFRRAAFAHVAALPLELGEVDQVDPDLMRVVVFPRSGVDRVTLAEFAVGVAMGKLSYSAQEWLWSG